MADFAPYQDVPERVRALSPPPQGVRSPPLSPRPEQQRQGRNIGTASVQSPTSPRAGEYFPPGAGWNTGSSGDAEQAHTRRGFGSGREDVDLFETRLGIRMDWEACLAYLLLPPAGAVFLLVVEHKSDYVR